MRILADENFPLPIVESLRKKHHDVLWARTDFAGLKDRALIERAEAEGRSSYSRQGLWPIALQRPIPLKSSGVILFRVFPALSANLGPLVASTLRVDQT